MQKEGCKKKIVFNSNDSKLTVIASEYKRLCERLKYYNTSKKQEFTDSYFFRLDNRYGQNSCFANVVVQTLLNMSSEFFSTIDKNSTTCQTSSLIKSEFLDPFRKRSMITHTSFKLREIVQTINAHKLSDSYINGTQQDAFSFLIDFINFSCDDIKQYFGFSKQYVQLCLACDSTSNNSNDQIHFYIGLNRYNVNQMPFEELFFSDFDRKCTNPDCKDSGSLKIRFEKYDFALNKFLILRIQSETNTFRSNMEILNFDPLKVVIPNSNNLFRVKSAIIHKSNCVGIAGQGGHYTYWKQFWEGWIEISDSVVNFHEKFVENLKDVYVLILEKLE